MTVVRTDKSRGSEKAIDRLTLGGSIACDAIVNRATGNVIRGGYATT